MCEDAAQMTVIASTRLGRIEGDAQAGVLVFRNVPYAAPPVGARRFRAPEPPAAWHGVRDGRVPGPTSPQVLGLMRDLPPQDEDCLHLNVWTPALHGRRPVLVWIHGGRFTSGASTHPMYDGRELARRGDVVVVTLNYRLGALGFIDLGALGEGHFSADANNGLRDQLAALRWVREHIADFGGDPEQVTLFGQSAGAMCVATLLTLPAARGLFKRAIAQSGAAHHTTTREDSARIAQRLLDALEIRPTQIERLRELPFAAITQAQAACLRQWVTCGPRTRPLLAAHMTLIPVVDGDLIAQRPFEAAIAGAGADVPLLVGTNCDEWTFFLFVTDSTGRDLDEAGLARAVEKRLPGQGARALNAYRPLIARARGSSVEPWHMFAAIECDRFFTLPALRLAEARADRGAATYAYRFDWTGPLFDGQMGSTHTMEVPFVFGLVDEGFGRVFSGGGPEARSLSDRVMDAWLAFARGGDPSCDRLGVWPRFDRAERSRMELARVCAPQAARFDPAIDALWSDVG
jgi:para-nitrobenzyl esterase